MDGAEISYAKINEFTWIRCQGKGNFLVSAKLKECAEHFLKQEEKIIVVDLEACTGMDSTFMGTLSGIALRLTKSAGSLHIASANEKNRSSLEDLGLSELMQINDEGAWSGTEANIRASLQIWSSDKKPDALQRSMLVLEAHKTLSATNESNAKKFETVVNLLENELETRRQISPGNEP